MCNVWIACVVFDAEGEACQAGKGQTDMVYRGRGHGECAKIEAAHILGGVICREEV
jgi:hypothetical protein